jgi:predicted nucleic acid-binding protein
LKVIDASAVSAMLFAEPEADVVVERIGGEPDLWLALNLGAELVTLDDRLRQAAAEA